MNKTLNTTATPNGDRTMTFVISNGGVDGDNDTIDPSGWDLENFRRNPVVLWSHGRIRLFTRGLSICALGNVWSLFVNRRSRTHH